MTQRVRSGTQPLSLEQQLRELDVALKDKSRGVFTEAQSPAREFLPSGYQDALLNQQDSWALPPIYLTYGSRTFGLGFGQLPKGLQELALRLGAFLVRPVFPESSRRLRDYLGDTGQTRELAPEVMRELFAESWLAFGHTPDGVEHLARTALGLEAERPHADYDALRAEGHPVYDLQQRVQSGELSLDGGLSRLDGPWLAADVPPLPDGDLRDEDFHQSYNGFRFAYSADNVTLSRDPNGQHFVEADLQVAFLDYYNWHDPNNGVSLVRFSRPAPGQLGVADRAVEPHGTPYFIVGVDAFHVRFPVEGPPARVDATVDWPLGAG